VLCYEIKLFRVY